MNRWQIFIEVWPHSTGHGQSADQAAAGDRQQSYEVQAENISDALVLAKHIVEGIRSNPAVWEAPITSIMLIATS